MTNNVFNGGFKVGILGGGQLGQMLIQSGISYNIHFSVLDPSADAPCRHLCKRFVTGDFNDFDTVYAFGKDCDLLTIEIEHVNVDALEKLQSEGKQVYPSPALIRMVQDKGLQKQFYEKNQIPTAEYHLLDNRQQLVEFIDFLPAAQKLRTGGYDGKGVSLLHQGNYIDASFDSPSVLEKQVDIKMELSFIVARNASGQMAVYPPVELVFNPKFNLVDLLVSPARISPETTQEGTAIAMKIAGETQLIGILAVEMFLDQNDQLLVNEMAPRPHNSGHQTIEGNITSQFEQHLRAILNLPLGDTATRQPAAMINLLGEDGFTGPATYEGMETILGQSGVYPHLYGKSTTKPGRKMGHITVIGAEINETMQAAEAIKNHIKVKA